VRTAFRIEAGSAVGLGHISRSTALAYEFKKRGLDVDIYVPQKSLPLDLKEELIKDFSLYELKSGNDSGIFAGYDYLVTDSYNITVDYLKRLKRRVGCLISIDDSNRIEFPVDYFINGALYAKDLTYRLAKNTKSLLGIKYFLLRRGLKRKRKKCTNEVKHIFLSVGAGNSGRIRKILHNIMERLNKTVPCKTKVSVIIGPYFENEDQKQFKNMVFYRHPQNINDLMSSSDIAISAGGQTLYELAFLGVPSVGICIGDDQKKNLKAFSKGGYCFYAGKIETKGIFTRLNALVNELLTDNKLRESMRARQLKLIDGFGPKRVADEILLST